MICENCKQECPDGNHRKKFCGQTCRNAYRYEPVHTECEECKEPIDGKIRYGKEKQYCSHDCRIRGNMKRYVDKRKKQAKRDPYAPIVEPCVKKAISMRW